MIKNGEDTIFTPTRILASVVIGGTALIGGAFVFGTPVKQEPTHREIGLTVPYHGEETTMKCLGQEALRLTVNGQDVTLKVTDCTQADVYSPAK